MVGSGGHPFLLVLIQFLLWLLFFFFRFSFRLIKIRGASNNPESIYSMYDVSLSIVLRSTAYVDVCQIVWILSSSLSQQSSPSGSWLFPPLLSVPAGFLPFLFDYSLRLCLVLHYNFLSRWRFERWLEFHQVFLPVCVFCHPHLHSASPDLHAIFLSSTVLLLPHTGLTRSYFFLFNTLLTSLQFNTYAMTSLIKSGVHRLHSFLFCTQNKQN